MVNNAFKEDISKAIKNTNVSTEFDAGSVGRRYEPALGTAKHNQRIHKESKIQDKYGNLPFTFSKPDFGKLKGKNAVKVCDNCGHQVYVKEKTIGVICTSCKTYSSVSYLEG